MIQSIYRCLTLATLSGVMISVMPSAHALEEQSLDIHVTTNDGGYAYLMFRTPQDRYFRETEYVTLNEDTADFFASIEMNRNVGKQFRCKAKVTGHPVHEPKTLKRKSGILTFFSVRECVEISPK